MKKCCMMITLFIGSASLLLAETNALIEVKLFKDWVIKGELSFCNLAIRNTGTESILLAKAASDFCYGQLYINKAKHFDELELERRYQEITNDGDGFFSLPPDEIQVYEGRKFYLSGLRDIFSDEMRFTVSVYLGKEFWLDSESLMYQGVVPDSEEYIATIASNLWGLAAVTCKDERWLYKKSITSNNYYPICPVSLTNKIRVEPHDNKDLFKIWDGDKSMIYHIRQSVLIEGSDEHNVLGKWTRERKQRAEADNAEVRRKKAEEAQ